MSLKMSKKINAWESDVKMTIETIEIEGMGDLLKCLWETSISIKRIADRLDDMAEADKKRSKRAEEYQAESLNIQRQVLRLNQAREMKTQTQEITGLTLKNLVETMALMEKSVVFKELMKDERESRSSAEKEEKCGR